LSEKYLANLILVVLDSSGHHHKLVVVNVKISITQAAINLQ
jgi:hypothetical protein